MANEGLVTAIIVTYNSQAVLEGCIKALLEQSVNCLVVDNKSGDNSVQIARDNGAQVIELEENVGFGVANNIGAAAAKSEFVLFINPDAYVTAEAVTKLVAAAGQYADAALLGPRLVEPDGRVFFQAKSLLSTYLKNPKGKHCAPEGDCCTPFLSGACMLMKRSFFLELGGFDPEIFLFFEDDDLCRRVTDAGLSIVYVHDAIVHHMRGKSSKPNTATQFVARANLAWSRGYVERKYGLTSNGGTTLLISGLKWLFAAITFNKKRMARHGGTWVGTWRSMRQQSRPLAPK